MSEHPVSPDRPSAPRKRPIQPNQFAWPLILIFGGIILLLNTTGVLSWRTWERIWPLWPVVLILLGVEILLGRRSRAWQLIGGLGMLLLLVVAGAYLVVTNTPEEGSARLDQSWPLAEVDRGVIHLQLGIGDIDLEAIKDRNDLAQIRMQAPEGVYYEHTLERRGGTAYLEVSGPENTSSWIFPWGGDKDIHWQVYLSDEVPLELEIDTGVGRSTLDLSGLEIEELVLRAGVGEMEVILPAQVKRGRVTVQAGIGKITLIIPEGVAAEIEASTGLGSTSVDTDRFPKTNGVYRSSNYDRAEYRLKIEVSGGIGEIDVR